MPKKPNAFGQYGKEVISLQHARLDPGMYGLLCFKTPEWNDFELSSMLWKTTDYRFVRSRKCLFEYLPKKGSLLLHFDTFYPKNKITKWFMPYLLRNLSDEEKPENKTRYIGYNSQRTAIVIGDRKTLPNQLSLFDEAPEDMLDETDSNYQNYNPIELKQWNETCRMLKEKSSLLDRFDYLMPINITQLDLLRPFLYRIYGINGVLCRFLTGNELENHDLFYCFEGYRNQLTEHLFPSKKQSHERMGTYQSSSLG